MDKIERMYEHCRINNINIDIASLEPSVLGVYVKPCSDISIIGLNKIVLNNRYIHMDVLSEELGHHHTTCGNFVGVLKRTSDRISLNKMERKASKWSCNFLIDDNELVSAIKYCTSFFEMAQYLDVPEHILRLKLELIRCKNGFLKMGDKVFDLNANGCFYNGYDGC